MKRAGGANNGGLAGAEEIGFGRGGVKVLTPCSLVPLDQREQHRKTNGHCSVVGRVSGNFAFSPEIYSYDLEKGIITIRRAADVAQHARAA